MCFSSICPLEGCEMAREDRIDRCCPKNVPVQLTIWGYQKNGEAFSWDYNQTSTTRSPWHNYCYPKSIYLCRERERETAANRLNIARWSSDPSSY